MNYARNTTTHATTGVKTWAVGFAAKELEIEVTPAPGGIVAEPRWSNGCSDGTNQVCDHVSIWPSNRIQQRFTNRLISVWEFIAGTWTEVFRIELDAANPWTATEVKYNVIIGNSNYQVHRKARG